MTTVYDISLRVAKEVMDVIESAATGGSTTNLTDTFLANFPADHFNNGRVWIKNNLHANKVLVVSDFAISAGSGVVTVPTLASVITSGTRYALARNTYPWDQIVSAIQQALDSTWVTGIDSTLEGDGETLEFTLPTGVFDLQKIYTENTAVAHGPQYISNHWKETATGVVRFDFGYAPRDGETIHIHYRSRHADLADYSTVISNEINLEWLKYKAAHELLYNFGMPTYGPAPEYRIEERLNKVINAGKMLTPRMIPDIRIQTAG